MASDRSERLFSYGSLRQDAVQQANFGRLLEGEDDSAAGWRIERIRIDDAAVVAVSGSAHHTIMVAGDDQDDCIEGVVFALSRDELAAADAYETADYARIEIDLRSGGRAWAYVRA